MIEMDCIEEGKELDVDKYVEFVKDKTKGTSKETLVTRDADKIKELLDNFSNKLSDAEVYKEWTTAEQTGMSLNTFTLKIQKGLYMKEVKEIDDNS